MEQHKASETDAKSRLLEAARAFVLKGEQKFSISQLCAEADVPRETFRMHFSGKTQMMAALMADAQVPSSPTQQTVSDSFPAATLMPAAAAADEPAPEAAATPAAARPETAAPTDAWLERRLRVFERALTALETKADAREREQTRLIAELEEKLARMDPADEPAPVKPVPQASQTAAPRPAPKIAHVEPLENILAMPAAVESEEIEDIAPQAEEKNPALLEITHPPAVSLSREAIAEVVQLARGKARAATAAEPASEKNPASRKRLLAIAALAAAVLLLCVGLSLGKGVLANGASAATENGVTHRHAAQGPLARTTALADAGDAAAQAKLALVYLKGEGVAADPAAALRWSRAAAEGGQPVAQYLMGSFYREGAGLAGNRVPADASAAFRWFEAAANKGNLKAMHNLAIAYAEGRGAQKNERQAAEWFTRAAERGYVDSAFDLAVLYERGLGVTQDLKQALTWYGIAAKMGDAPAEERVSVLRGQISHEAAASAAAAAQNFTPVPPLVEANQL